MVKMVFVTKVISNGRITIPEIIRETLSLKEGDTIYVSVESWVLARGKLVAEGTN